MQQEYNAIRFRIFAATSVVPLAVITSLVGFYFMKWATDVLLIAPAVVGTLIAIGSIWDGASDPMVAAYTDRRRSKRGRRKPIMRISVILIAIGAPMMWLAPESLSPWLLAGWVLIGILVFEAGHTMFMVPLGALGLEVFKTKRSRYLLQLAVTIPSLIITIAALVGFQILLSSDTPRTVLAWIIGIPVAILIFIVAAGLKYLPEPPSDHRPMETSIWQMLSDVLGNKYHRSILLIQATQAAAYTSILLTTPYLLDTILNAELYLPSVYAVFYLAQIMSLPLQFQIARRLGIKNTWQIGIACWATAFLLVFLIPILGPGAGLVAIFGIALLAGFAQSAGTVVYPIMGDLADYDSDQSGQRREGLYVTIFRLISKIIAALVAFIFGWGLQFAGYDATLDIQPQEVTSALMISGSVLPFAMCLFGLWWLRRWSFYDRQGRPDRLEAA